jgi:hypothetical protein
LRTPTEIPGYSPRSDVCAADLQEKPTKRTAMGKPSEAVISSGSTKTAASSEHRSERSEPSDTASLGERSNEARLTGAIRAERALASGAIKNVLVLWVALVRLDASVDRSRYG